MTDSEPSDAAAQVPPAAAQAPPAAPSHCPSLESFPKIIPSSELLQGSREVWIEHGSEMYRLRLTASGKLYLTK
ncbi:hemin uptake protein HemP [Novipirellula sp.]|uniref:hemin uptake protein HemP n=1 Tax=Novipirellula sp. TaxID=2795430 RepID=UPI003568D355